MADENNAYVGYRSAGRRPESRQGRRAAADAPLAALRGFASGVLGGPGDIEALIRMLPGLSERTVLPTSEDVLKRLPLAEVSATPTGRAFTAASQLGGGFYAGPGSPLKVLAESPRIIGRAARDFAQSVSPVHVIKPKGGNWLAGSAERALEPLKQSYPEIVAPGIGLTEDVIRSRHPQIEAMNKWLDQKLGKYIRNEMGTPEDPIRVLAERGVLHAEPQVYGPMTKEDLWQVREMEGFVGQGLGQSELARRWEDASDLSFYPNRAGYLTRTRELENNPWLAKVPPETSVYEIGPRGSAFGELGFGHLTDELRNAVNPESGLPAALQWKYADLDKVTVPQAVERVSKINDWRAAQQAEANAMRANNAAAALHKDYEDAPYKWVELKAPEADVSDIRFETGSQGVRAFDAEGNRLVSPGGYNTFKSEEDALKQLRDERARKPLEDALKYEGETMGHCVGGYCPDVLEGRSRIFSLRNKKTGEPHVTIEVGAPRNLDDQHIPNRYVDEALDMLGGDRPGLDQNRVDELARELFTMENPAVSDIVQIKGKANRAPKEEYLPYVQDFVRSGQWGRVGDLENTGLRRIDPQSDLGSRLREAGFETPPYVSESELTELLDRYGRTTLPSSPKPAPDAEGFAAGGVVQMNPAKIQALIDSLHEEPGNA